jgi:orotate phosphoribosyltransferase
MKARLDCDTVRVAFAEILMDHQEQLRRLLSTKSVVWGRFTLSSGKVSDYYIDCKLTTLDPEGAVLTGYTVLERLDKHGVHAQAIGGPPIGAHPIVAAVAAVSYYRTKFEGKGPSLPAFLIRKEAKPHGLQKKIEGIDLSKIHDVVIVDEVCTEGKSTQEALTVVEEAGLHVVAVMSLVDREEGGSTKLRAKYGNRYIPIFTARELLELSSEIREEASQSAKDILHETTAIRRVK